MRGLLFLTAGAEIWSRRNTGGADKTVNKIRNLPAVQFDYFLVPAVRALIRSLAAEIYRFVSDCITDVFVARRFNCVLASPHLC